MSQSYFRVKEGNGPSKKSVNKISDIGVVEEQELREALAKLIPKHEKEQADLMQRYRTCYQKWKFQLSCGFGLLLYGFGSKKTLLEDFANSALVDGAAIVVNGYLPSVNIKHVVFTIANILWETKKKMKKKKQSASAKQKKTNGCTHPLSSNSLEDLLAFLTDDEELAPVYVIVHNIDGPGVRDDDTQLTLASVAGSRHYGTSRWPARSSSGGGYIPQLMQLTLWREFMSHCSWLQQELLKVYAVLRLS
ncbi:hypothetical protein BDL97_10G064700 [Sphagnum fallax]|nr:hypothetical protein BDL97_10G064700 [Sphagnum fallax]